MTRWAAGAAEIERLLNGEELERVTPNIELSDRLLEEADRHIVTAESAADTDPTGGYQLAYDASRKACAATLATQGLRASRAGGHIAVRSAVVAQFGAANGGDVLQMFDVMRRRRQQAEYPDEKSQLIDSAEAREAIECARAIVALVRIAMPHLEAW